MTSNTRRSFLRGLLCAPAIVSAASLMPINPRLLFPSAPKLWADGVHDDTAALQWRIDDCKRRGEQFMLINGFYRVDGTVTVPAGIRSHVSGCEFVRLSTSEAPVFYFASGAEVSSATFHFVA